MINQPASSLDDRCAAPQLPVWGTARRAETSESVAFRAGAVLAVLDQLVRDPGHGVPLRLLANRGALRAAVATSKLEGRLAREADIRDAFHLTPAGAACGPDGDLLAFWREAAVLRIAGRGLPKGMCDLIGTVCSAAEAWLRDGADRAGTHGPLAGCGSVLRSVLQADDRAERVACLLSDIVLARALNWPFILPVTARRLSKAGLRGLLDGQGGELAVQAALLQSIEETVQDARALAPRAAALRAVAPKLRAKGSAAAVELFLREDAVVPATMLAPRIKGSPIPMTARAARRFCDRLVTLGVARELTGRETFRLYGIAP